MKGSTFWILPGVWVKGSLKRSLKGIHKRRGLGYLNGSWGLVTRLVNKAAVFIMTCRQELRHIY